MLLQKKLDFFRLRSGKYFRLADGERLKRPQNTVYRFFYPNISDVHDASTQSVSKGVALMRVARTGRYNKY